MIFISHRGNVFGPNPDLENKIDHIIMALSLGFDVEVDVWYQNDRWWLGHDSPQYPLNPQFLVEKNLRLWCHAKTVETLEALINIGTNCFFHEADRATLTARGFIWNLCGTTSTAHGIYIAPIFVGGIIDTICAGICSDEIARYKKEWDTRHPLSR